MAAPLPSGDTHEPSRICGLLYCGDSEERHVNLAADETDPLTIYVRNALTLARSANVHGQEITLVTNDAARIAALVAREGGADAGMKLEELLFTLDVPRAIPFRSAHFKLELLRIFGEGRFGEFPVLVDIDVVLIHPLRFSAKDVLWAYDISAQEWGAVPDRRATATLDLLAGQPLASHQWFGGEFLAGSSERFAELSREIARIWPTYCASVHAIQHPGDEMVLSSALNLLAERGFPWGDAGAAGLVARWWSVHTTNAIGSLTEAEVSALLHLPADKAFLAQFSDRAFDVSGFLSAYRNHVSGRLRGNRMRSIAARLRGRRHAPALT